MTSLEKGESLEPGDLVEINYLPPPPARFFVCEVIRDQVFLQGLECGFSFESLRLIKKKVPE